MGQPMQGSTAAFISVQPADQLRNLCDQTRYGCSSKGLQVFTGQSLTQVGQTCNNQLTAGAMEQTQACQNYAQVCLTQSERKRDGLQDLEPFRERIKETNLPLQLRPTGITKRNPQQMDRLAFLFSQTGSPLKRSQRSFKTRSIYKTAKGDRPRKDSIPIWQVAKLKDQDTKGFMAPCPPTYGALQRLDSVDDLALEIMMTEQPANDSSFKSSKAKSERVLEYAKENKRKRQVYALRKDILDNCVEGHSRPSKNAPILKATRRLLCSQLPAGPRQQANYDKSMQQNEEGLLPRKASIRVRSLYPSDKATPTAALRDQLYQISSLQSTFPQAGKASLMQPTASAIKKAENQAIPAGAVATEKVHQAPQIRRMNSAERPCVIKQYQMNGIVNV